MTKSEKIAGMVAPFAGQKHDPHYLAYFDYFNRGLFYEAHDVLENLWLPLRKSPEGDFYKGLIQLAGAFVHLQKNRLKPASALFKLAQTNLQKYGKVHQHLELQLIHSLIDHCATLLSSSNYTENALSTIGAPKLQLKDQFRAATALAFVVLACSIFCSCTNTKTVSTGPKAPPMTRPSSQTYVVHWLPHAGIALDGKADEPAWQRAVVEKHFVFPWKNAPAPETEFRALCDGTNIFFAFRVQDADIVVLDQFRDEEDGVFEDRVEVYLSRDDRMKDYYCFEVDSRGRIFDYRGSYWRHLDTKWNFEGMRARGSAIPGGYEVEIQLPLKSLEVLGFPPIHPGSKIRCGLYRAEFSHDRSGRPVDQKKTLHNLGRKIEGPPPIEEWISWVDPQVKEPDFHIPASLGWLEFQR